MSEVGETGWGGRAGERGGENLGGREKKMGGLQKKMCGAPCACVVCFNPPCNTLMGVRMSCPCRPWGGKEGASHGRGSGGASCLRVDGTTESMAGGAKKNILSRRSRVRRLPCASTPGAPWAAADQVTWQMCAQVGVVHILPSRRAGCLLSPFFFFSR